MIRKMWSAKSISGSLGSRGVGGAENWKPERLVAAYSQRFTTEECFKGQKNDQYEGFLLDAVTLSTPERWDRMLLGFAWAYYGWNVAGWARETAGKAREWRANTR